MPFPVDVVTTTVVESYVDATGKPAKGYVVFKPDLSSIGDGIAVAPISVRRNLVDGAFSIDIPASVNTGLDPDFPYEVTVSLTGGSYTKRLYQIPVSAEPIRLEELVPVTQLPSRVRFVFPSWTVPPINPQPGETYYDPATGDTYYWNAVLTEWVPVVGAPSGPAGGSLAGTYPNPTLAANSVDTVQLKAASVTADKLASSYVTTLAYNNDLAITAANFSDVQNQIDGKADIGHLHVIGDITDLQVQLDGKQPAGTYLVPDDIAGLLSVTQYNESIQNYLRKDVVTAQTMNGALRVDGIFTVGNSGTMLIGADTNLYRVGVDVLATDDGFNVGGNLLVYGGFEVQGAVVGIDKADVGLNLVDNTSDANKPVSTAQQAALDLKANLTDLYIRPQDHNLTGWTFDPEMVQAGTVIPTAGLSYIFRIKNLGTVITNVHIHITTPGSGLTAGQCFVTVHNDAGAILGAGAVSADQAANWAVGGFKTIALSTPQSATPGAFYRVRLWFNGTTGPTLSRAVNSSSAIVNPGLSAPNFRYSTADNGLTTAALAPNNIGAQTGGSTAWWVAFS